MRTGTKIIWSIVASLAISALVLLFAVSILRDIQNETSRIQVYGAINDKIAALNLSLAMFPSQPDTSRILQIKAIRASLEKLLEPLQSFDVREELLLRQIRTNARELGYSFEKLISQPVETKGARLAERRDVLVSQLWMKTQFISDDMQDLMEISQARIKADQRKASILILALIVTLILANAFIFFFSGRSIMRVQKRLRKALAEAEEGRRTLQSMMEHIPIGISIAEGPDVTIKAVSRYGLEMTGKQRQQIENIPADRHAEQWQIFCADGITPALDKSLPLTRATQLGELIEQEEWVLGRPDGSKIPVICTAAPIRDSHGNITGGVIGWQDITQRKSAEQRLRESEERYRTLFESIDEGFCTIEILFDTQGNPTDYRYLETNPAFTRHTGLADAVGKTALKLIPGLERHWVESYGRIALTGEPEQFVQEVKTLGRWFEIDAFRIGKPELCRVAVLFNDITQRRQAEIELQQLNEMLEQRVAERTVLAETRARQLQALAVELIEAEEQERRRVARLLHEDLQQILASARYQLQAARSHGPVEPILANVEHLLEESITKSRRLSHELSPAVLYHAGLGAALNWLAGQMKEQFGLHLRLETAPDQPLESVPLKVFIFRAAQELLFNVVKHSGVKSAHLALTNSQNGIIVVIRDQGTGFDPEILASMPSKVGLGLLSIRERASYIGGGLEIQSAPGQGTCLTLTVPLTLSETDAPHGIDLQTHYQPLASVGSQAAATDRDIRVLFADDHRVMRQGLIRLMAGKPNIQVVGEAADGREAIELARQLRPDVVVMDISMPEVDGIEATRTIKIELPDVRVIGLSMLEDAQAELLMRQAGAETFVSKAASAADLLKAIYGATPVD